MNLAMIREKAWGTFEKKFPDAYSFLLEESLRGELCYLARLSQPNEWEKKRLEELEKILKS